MANPNPPSQNLPTRSVRLGDVVRLSMPGLVPDITTHVIKLAGTSHAHVNTHAGFSSLPIHISKFEWDDHESWWKVSI